MQKIIVDMKEDKFAIKKEYPYPMEIISENDDYVEVRNKGEIELIDKKDVKNIHRLNIKGID